LFKKNACVHVLRSSLIFLGMFDVATDVQLHQIVPNKRHLAVLQPAHVHGSLPERLPLYVDAVLSDECVTALASGVFAGTRALAVILGLDHVQLVRRVIQWKLSVQGVGREGENIELKSGIKSKLNNIESKATLKCPSGQTHNQQLNNRVATTFMTMHTGLRRCNRQDPIPSVHDPKVTAHWRRSTPQADAMGDLIAPQPIPLGDRSRDHTISTVHGHPPPSTQST